MSQSNDKSRQAMTESGQGGIPVLKTSGVRPLNAPNRRRGPAGASQEISPQFVISALLHWWKVAAPLGIVLAAASAVAVWWWFVPTYKARALVQIRETPPSLVFDVQKESKSYVETQKEMIRSARVLRPVAQSSAIRNLPELEGRQDKVLYLQQAIQLSSVGKSEFLRVEFDGPNPENAARIVNAVVKQYFALLSDVTDEQNTRVIGLLQDEIDRRKESVRERRKDIQAKTLTDTGKDPFAATLHNGANWPHPLAELQNQLTTAEVEREVAEAEFKALKESPIRVPKEVLAAGVSRSVQGYPQVQNLEAKIWTAETALREMESLTRDPSADPQCLRRAEEIARDKKRLHDLKVDLEKRYQAELMAAASARRQEELAAKKLTVERDKRMEEVLRERYDAEMKKVAPGVADMVKIEFERAELDRSTDVLNRIEQRVVELRTEKRAPERVILYDAAQPPQAPVVAVPYAKMGLAGLVAFCIPFGLAVGWERIVRRINGPEQLERETNLAVIGEISRLPERRTKAAESKSRRISQELRLYEESIDSMRTFLVLAEDLKDARVLAVTSAASNEGKTSVAAQLALSLARASGKPTLLIDGDMRAPDMQAVFEVRRTPGLAEVLAGKCDLEDGVAPTWTPTVDVLPAGDLKENVHKLVGNGALRSLLQRTSEKYAYVVLDTPPILAAAESLVLSKSADACLICAMQDVSRAGQVRSACERLLAAGCRPVAAVLNGVPPRRYEYRYGRYVHAGDEG